ncbi:class I SAM-dependent methyltransferase [Phytoactinopolyspora endophytica]|uniref:class I SAM-dependent methyltransferase n=1 Tax=Phytoactinopolyspora endophytica TaxID=1642495 RepID=UPI00101D4588|nr:class I SAM-dependent methyltransferase [Phytoactinopolyspora endophytica]
MLEPAVAEELQRTWDLQQETYLPYRESAFTALLDSVEAVGAEHGRVLDLAGGTGSLSRRLTRRFPGIDVTLLDLDPVLLAIASASVAPTVNVVRADLGAGDWVAALPYDSYDAVVTATSLHCLPPDRLRVLYGEIRQVIAPGGLFCNADRMAEDNLATMTARLAVRREERSGPRHTWQDWWKGIASDPRLASVLRERGSGLTSADWYPPGSWHMRSLADAGFDEAGVVWRREEQAVVAAMVATGADASAG